MIMSVDPWDAYRAMLSAADRLVAESRKPAAYDQAVVLLRDLREISDTGGRSPKFKSFVDDLRERHRAKVSFLKRLDRTKV
jgi:hypothetical protein